MKRSPIKRNPDSKPLARSYLKRYTPLRPLSRKKVREKRAKLGLADEAYLVWVRRLSCVVCRIEKLLHAHHLKFGRGDDRGGMGIRVHDQKTIPLCSRHHRHFHRGIGFFKGWSKEQKREWQEEWIGKLRARYAKLQGKST